MNSAPEITRRAPEAPVRVLPIGQDPDDVADLWPARSRPRGTVVILHGGFWREQIDRQHASHMARALADDGWEAISLEYPRLAGDPDRTHRTVITALHALLQSEITVTPVVLLGHSAGGQLALWATATQEVEFTTVVALAPVTSLRRAERQGLGEGAVRSFLGGPAEDRPDLDPEQLDAPSEPTVILHGDVDQRVPVDHSRRYVENRPDVRMTPIAGAGHFDLIDPRSAYWPAVRDALRLVGPAQ